MAVSIEQLRDLFDCAPQSGTLRWKARPEVAFSSPRSAKSWNTQYAGKPALTYVDLNGYCVGNVWGRPYKAHRVIWAIHNGEWPTDEIDHINGVRTDNRIENLRVVTRGQNASNVSRKSTNTSGASGLSRHQRGWRVRFQKNNSVCDFGTFACFAKALEARMAAAKDLGFSATHGIRRSGN